MDDILLQSCGYYIAYKFSPVMQVDSITTVSENHGFMKDEE